MSLPRRALTLAAAALAAACLLPSVARPAADCTRTWTGPGGVQSWTDPANWTPAGKPAPTDHVCIPDAAEPLTVVLEFENADVLSVTSAETLRVAQNVTLALAEASTVSTLHLEGTLAAAGPLAVTSAFDWTSGALRGAGTTTVPAGVVLDMPGPALRVLEDGHRLQVAGDARLAEGPMALEHGSVLDVEDAGVLTVGAEDVLAVTGFIEPGHIESTGLIRKAAGTGTTSIAAELDNDGQVVVETGRLSLGGTGPHTATGTYAATGAGELVFSGTHLLGGAAAIDGPALLDGVLAPEDDLALTGEITLDGTIFADAALIFADGLTWTDGRIAGAGTTTIPAGVVLELPGGATRVLDEGHRLRLLGEARLPEGVIALERESVLDVEDSGVLTVGTEDIVAVTGFVEPGHVESTGLIRKTAGTGRTLIAAALDNDGQVVVETGRLSLGGTGPHTATGTYAATGAGGLDFIGQHALAGAATIDGPAVLDGVLVAEDDLALTGEITLDGTIFTDHPLTIADALTWTSGTISGAGTSTIPDGVVLDMPGGTLRVLDEGHRLRLLGEARLPEGVIALERGSVLDVEDSGVLTVGTEDIVAVTGFVEPGHVESTGLIRKTAGTGTTSIAAELDNDGQVVVDTGRLSLGGTGPHTATGTYAATGAGGLDFIGQHALAGAATIDGPAVLDGVLVAEDDLVLTDPIELDGTIFTDHPLTIADGMTWTDGTISGAGTTTIPAGVVLDLPGTGQRVLDQGQRLRLEGEASLPDGRLLLEHGSVLDIEESGVLAIDTEDPNGLRGFFEPGHVENTGTIRKAAGSGTTHILAELDNDGEVTSSTGTLVLGSGRGTLVLGGTGPHTATGTYSATGAGALRLLGLHRLAGAAAVDGPASVEGDLQADDDLALSGAIALDGTITTTDEVTIADALTWTAGAFAGGGSVFVPAGGELELTTGSNKSLLGSTTLYNAGEMAWRDGSIIVERRARIENHGLLEAASENGSVFRTGAGTGGHVLYNAGTVRKSSGAGTTALLLHVVNSGTVDVRTGRLSLLELVQGPAARLRIELRGPEPFTEHGVLDASASALNGTVELVPAGGFDPAVGEDFTVVTWDAREGEVAAVAGAPGAGRRWVLLHDPQGLRARVEAAGAAFATPLGAGGAPGATPPAAPAPLVTPAPRPGGPAPFARPERWRLARGGRLVRPARRGVLANEAGAGLSVDVLRRNRAARRLRLRPDGSVRFRPPRRFTGVARVVYVVVGPAGARSAPAALTVRVTRRARG